MMKHLANLKIYGELADKFNEAPRLGLVDIVPEADQTNYDSRIALYRTYLFRLVHNLSTKKVTLYYGSNFGTDKTTVVDISDQVKFMEENFDIIVAESYDCFYIFDGQTKFYKYNVNETNTGLAVRYSTEFEINDKLTTYLDKAHSPIDTIGLNLKEYEDKLDPSYYTSLNNQIHPKISRNILYFNYYEFIISIDIPSNVVTKELTAPWFIASSNIYWEDQSTYQFYFSMEPYMYADDPSNFMVRNGMSNNLYDPNKRVIGWINETTGLISRSGTILNSTQDLITIDDQYQDATSEFIKIDPNKTYYFSYGARPGTNQLSLWYAYAFYDESRKYLSRIANQGAVTNVKLSIPANTAYIRVGGQHIDDNQCYLKLEQDEKPRGTYDKIYWDRIDNDSFNSMEPWKPSADKLTDFSLIDTTITDQAKNAWQAVKTMVIQEILNDPYYNSSTSLPTYENIFMDKGLGSADLSYTGFEIYYGKGNSFRTVENEPYKEDLTNGEITDLDHPNLLTNSYPYTSSLWSFTSEKPSASSAIIPNQYLEVIPGTEPGWTQYRQIFSEDNPQYNWFYNLNPGQKIQVSFEISMSTLPSANFRIYGSVRQNGEASGNLIDSGPAEHPLVKDIVKKTDTWYRVTLNEVLPDQWIIGKDKISMGRFIIEGQGANSTDKYKLRKAKVVTHSTNDKWEPSLSEVNNNDSLDQNYQFSKNLLNKTDKYRVTGSKNGSYDYPSDPSQGLVALFNTHAGETMTLSADISFSGYNKDAHGNNRIGLEIHLTGDNGISDYIGCWYSNISYLGSHTERISNTFTVPNKLYTNSTPLYAYNQLGDVNFTIEHARLEMGSIAHAWQADGSTDGGGIGFDDTVSNPSHLSPATNVSFSKYSGLYTFYNLPARKEELITSSYPTTTKTVNGETNFIFANWNYDASKIDKTKYYTVEFDYEFIQDRSAARAIKHRKRPILGDKDNFYLQEIIPAPTMYPQLAGPNWNAFIDSHLNLIDNPKGHLSGSIRWDQSKYDSNQIQLRVDNAYGKLTIKNVSIHESISFELKGKAPVDIFPIDEELHTVNEMYLDQDKSILLVASWDGWFYQCSVDPTTQELSNFKSIFNVTGSIEKIIYEAGMIIVLHDVDELTVWNEDMQKVEWLKLTGASNNILANPYLLFSYQYGMGTYIYKLLDMPKPFFDYAIIEKDHIEQNNKYYLNIHYAVKYPNYQFRTDSTTYKAQLWYRDLPDALTNSFPATNIYKNGYMELLDIDTILNEVQFELGKDRLYYNITNQEADVSVTNEGIPKPAISYLDFIDSTGDIPLANVDRDDKQNGLIPKIWVKDAYYYSGRIYFRLRFLVSSEYTLALTIPGKSETIVVQNGDTEIDQEEAYATILTDKKYNPVRFYQSTRDFDNLYNKFVWFSIPATDPADSEQPESSKLLANGYINSFSMQLYQDGKKINPTDTIIEFKESIARPEDIATRDKSSFQTIGELPAEIKYLTNEGEIHNIEREYLSDLEHGPKDKYLATMSNISFEESIKPADIKINKSPFIYDMVNDEREFGYYDFTRAYNSWQNKDNILISDIYINGKHLYRMSFKQKDSLTGSLRTFAAVRRLREVLTDGDINSDYTLKNSDTVILTAEKRKIYSSQSLIYDHTIDDTFEDQLGLLRTNGLSINTGIKQTVSANDIRVFLKKRDGIFYFVINPTWYTIEVDREYGYIKLAIPGMHDLALGDHILFTTNGLLDSTTSFTADY